jgi:AcrR family transcriptional regulator
LSTTAVKKKPAPARPARRRLSAEEARERILAATEVRLRDHGPDALRLQEIAADVGVSHPTVLHHFGSREELVRAVVHRSILKLETDLIALFAEPSSTTDVGATLHHVDEVLRQRGQARLLAWLALTTPQSDRGAEESRLADLTRALHAGCVAQGIEVSFEEVGFTVVAGTAATFGAALLGPGLFAMSGLANDEDTMRRYREWLAALLQTRAEK